MEKQIAINDPRGHSVSDDGAAYGPVHDDNRRVSYYDVHSTAGVDGPIMSEADATGKAMCPMLMYSIVVIGASAFLYGYDNAIVSPVAALQPFVSIDLTQSYLPRLANELVRSSDTKASTQ